MAVQLSFSMRSELPLLLLVSVALSISSTIAKPLQSTAAFARHGGVVERIRVNGLDNNDAVVEGSQFTVTWGSSAVSAKLESLVQVFDAQASNYDEAIHRIIAPSRASIKDMDAHKRTHKVSPSSAVLSTNQLKGGRSYLVQVQLCLNATTMLGCSEATGLTFHFADPDWSSSQWLGTAQMLRTTVNLASKPSSLKVYVSGVGYYHVFVNGVKVTDSAALNGVWSVYNKRVFYDVFDASSALTQGENTIAVLLGYGWRDTTAFAPQGNSASPSCDSNKRLVRLIGVNGDNQVIFSTSNTTWTMSNNGSILSDSVYDGETFDSRIDSTAWLLPNFTDTWPAAKSIDCFSPVLSVLAQPRVTVQSVRPPLSINTLNTCPANTVGGIADENTNLTLTCSNGGTIKSITFASFGTPTGACGAFKTGSCNANDTVSIVEKLCVGKSSCSISASDTVFGDPCYGTVKQLAVQGVGCSTPAKYVVDFGENLSGVVRINATGPSGTPIVLRHAEVLQHPPYGPADGNIYTGNLRSAQATDTFILNGKGAQTYTPSFTYHGFRFVEVTGYPGQLNPEDIAMLHFRTSNTITTKFQTSSKILNTIQYGALYGQGSNMMSVPTDCDQRDERLGWMGDANLSSLSFALNFDISAFIINFLRSMVDNQDDKGALSDVVPFYRYGNQPADPSWSAALTENMWVQYAVDNNIAPAEGSWAALDAYMGNLAAQVAAVGGISNWKPSYGDWVPAGPNKVPGQLCSTFNYINSAKRMVDLASAMGNTTGVEYYRNVSNNLMRDYNASFYQADKQCWGDCGQSSYGLSFGSGVVTDVTSVMDQLKQAINATQNHVTVGIIGAKTMFPALTRYNATAVALSLAEQVTMPSWGFMFYNTLEPATSSVWELWNGPYEGPGMNSRNHHMFSSISGWLVTDIGGLQSTVCDTTKGMILSAGYFPISSTSVSRVTPCGKVAVDWMQVSGTHQLKAPLTPPSVKQADHNTNAVTVSCNEEFGAMNIQFASFGKPFASGPTLELNPKCHFNETYSYFEDCIGHPSCYNNLTLLAEEFDAPSSCFEDDSPLRLYIQYQCLSPVSYNATVTVPTNQLATFYHPTQNVDTVSVNGTPFKAKVTTYQSVPSFEILLEGGVYNIQFYSSGAATAKRATVFSEQHK
eukprot:m.354639 g.354639  ORF g.354639 m.354639 type:complete len:1153 (-) comp17070_c0_seq1:211-3669(-)